MWSYILFIEWFIHKWVPDMTIDLKKIKLQDSRAQHTDKVHFQLITKYMSITKENNLNTTQFRLTQHSYAQQIMKCKHDVAQKVNAFPKMSNTHMGSFRDSHKGEKELSK